jgi:ATP-dependent protease ClpP protease subunit
MQTGEALIYGDIDVGSAERLRKDVARIGEIDRLVVAINSRGGDVFEGVAMHAHLASLSYPKIARIDGLAASIASVIAMACDEVEMASGSFMMLHQPQGGTYGTAREMMKTSRLLDNIHEQLASIYSRLTGISVEQISAMMIEETWMNAEEAVSRGFADRVLVREAMAASADLSQFTNVPPQARALLERKMDITEKAEVPEVGGKDYRRAYSCAGKLGFDASAVDDLLDKGIPAVEVPDMLIQEFAAKAKRQDTGSLIPSGCGGIGNGTDGPRAELQEALTARLGGQAATGNPWAGRRVADIAREVHRVAGRNVWSMSDSDVIAWRTNGASGGSFLAAAQHTTSDFPSLLAASANKVLLERYQLAQSPLVTIARRRDRVNFKAGTSIRIGTSPSLKKVLEAGEITYGTIAEQGESWSLATYARLFAVSYQALANDDLGGFQDVLASMAAAAAQVEADLLFGVLSASAFAGQTMSDGFALFSTQHANVAAAPAAIAVASLDLAFQAMRAQKDLGGEFFINAQPRYLLTGPKQALVAKQVTAPLTPNATTDVNPYSGDLTILIEPRFAATTNWYLFGDPGLAAVLEYGGRVGMNGPQLAMREGWNVLGQEFRCVHDVGAGAVDWRGAHRNAGA